MVSILGLGDEQSIEYLNANQNALWHIICTVESMVALKNITDMPVSKNENLYYRIYVSLEISNSSESNKVHEHHICIYSDSVSQYFRISFCIHFFSNSQMHLHTKCDQYLCKDLCDINEIALCHREDIHVQ